MERELCKCLCKAVKKPSDEGMRAEIANISRSMGVDLKAKKAWISSNGRKGFPAIAVEFASKFPPNLHVKSVLIIVFRSTTGLAEWLEYLVRFNKVPRDGDNKNGTLKILKVWKRALDETWCKPSLPAIGGENTMRGMIWRQLEEGGRVWLTGHSRGGAVATTAASRLVLGDSACDTRQRDTSWELSSALKRLSVFTFNAPKALNGPLAKEYNMKLNDIGTLHLRFETPGDIVVGLPPSMCLSQHVGLAIPKAKATAFEAPGNKKVRLVRIGVGLFGGGYTLAVWAMCRAGLVDGGSMLAIWCFCVGMLIAVGLGAQACVKVKEERNGLHALSGPLFGRIRGFEPKAEEEKLPLNSIIWHRRIERLRFKYEKRVAFLNGLNTASTDDQRIKVEKKYLRKTIIANSPIEGYVNGADGFFMGLYGGD